MPAGDAAESFGAPGTARVGVACTTAAWEGFRTRGRGMGDARTSFAGALAPIEVLAKVGRIEEGPGI